MEATSRVLPLNLAAIIEDVEPEQEAYDPGGGHQIMQNGIIHDEHGIKGTGCAGNRCYHQDHVNQGSHGDWVCCCKGVSLDSLKFIYNI